MVASLGGPMDEPGVQVLGHQGVLEALGEPIHHRGEHLDVDVAADLTAPHAVLHELERPVRIFAAHEPIDRSAEAEPRVVAADHGDPVGHPVLPAELLGPLEPPVERGPEAALDDALGRIEPRREAGDGSLVRGQEQPFLAGEVQEDRALGHAHLGGDVLDARAAEAVLGEMPHRDVDDPVASGFGVGSALDAGPHGSRTVAEIVEPEGPPARREPKLSATVSPSGSVAPSNLRFRRADLRTPQDRLAALPTVRRRGLRLAASSGGGAPTRLPLAGSSAVRAAVPALRPSRPTRCCLAAFPSLGPRFRLAASPLPRPVPSRRLLRLLGARRNVSATRTGVNLTFPQVRAYICRSGHRPKE